METGWRVTGASVKGTSHQKRGMPCQDAFDYCIVQDETAVVAVADGAGSAERSHEGARRAIAGALTWLEPALTEGMPENDAEWEGLLAEAFRQARAAVLRLATIERISSRELATTLTCAVACTDWLVVGQVGDGVVVAKGADGDLFAASQPQHGEYANETYFLTMDEALQRVEVRVYSQSIEALAVLTDGLIRLATNVATNEPHLPFFQPLMAFASQMESEVQADEQLTALLMSDRVCARTDDDKTLVLVARPHKSEPAVVPDQKGHITDQDRSLEA